MLGIIFRGVLWGLLRGYYRSLDDSSHTFLNNPYIAQHIIVMVGVTYLYIPTSSPESPKPQNPGLRLAGNERMEKEM